MPELSLPFGNGFTRVAIPDEWLGLVADLKAPTGAPDAAALIRSALEAPTGCLPLRELARPGMRAVVIVDDYTRHTPTHLVLPLIIEELRLAGLPRKDICIVVASGSHRRMTPAETLAKVGLSAVEGHEVIHAAAGDSEELVSLGETQPGGIPAWVDRRVAQADLRVGIGMVTPHLDAGFSGGAKLILPGVCGMATIHAFHAASAFIPGNPLGNVDAPLRRSLEAFVAEKAPLHFLVNLVLAPDGAVAGCTAGHMIQAHRQGVELARQVYGVPAPRRYPLVLANCAPYDHDLWQSVKGIWCGDLLVEDGGTLVVLSAAPEGSRAHPSLPACIGRDPQELIAELLAGTAREPMVAATGVMISNLRRRIRLVLVFPGLSHSELVATRLPFFPTVEAALDDLVGELSPSLRQGCLAVVPQAGVALPMVKC